MGFYKNNDRQSDYSLQNQSESSSLIVNTEHKKVFRNGSKRKSTSEFILHSGKENLVSYIT
jgi:hypothetical protein